MGLVYIEIGSELNEEGLQVPAYGFDHKGTFVTDPFISECGRFDVNPEAYYRISLRDAWKLVRLNKVLQEATS